MARPRTASDDEILDAVGRAMGRVGPHALRLRDVADEAGLAPPTLVQRFGSKRELLLACSRRAARDAGTPFRTHRRKGDPLGTLERGLLAGLGAHGSPEALAHHMAWFELNLADAEFHALAAEYARRREKAIRKLLQAAVRKGQLRKGTRVGRLARAVEVTVHGALATWPLYRRRSLKRWVRRELRATLAPHRTS